MSLSRTVILDNKMETSKPNHCLCCSVRHCHHVCDRDDSVCPFTTSKAADAAQAAAERYHLAKHASVPFQALHVGCQLGKGAFCSVQEVELNQHRFAMKKLLSKVKHQQAQFVEGASDLATEAALLSNLDHENIIHMYGMAAGSVRDCIKNSKEGLFLIMDRLETTLDRKIKEWKTQEETMNAHDKTNCQKHFWERMEVALQIAKGLQYLHSKNVVHRDLKPANIGLDEDGVAKVFDFGLSEILHDKNELLEEICGSPRYMAPEVLLERPNGMKVDVYAFGLILWELCALKKAFRCDTRDEFDMIMKKVSRRGYRPSIDRSWPRPIQKLIRQCWSQSPRSRPSMNKVVSTLVGIRKNHVLKQK